MVANDWLNPVGNDTGWATEAVPTPYPEPYQINPPVAGGTYGGDAPMGLLRQNSRCSRDTHYFECKHERFCSCKQTSRLPIEVDKDL